MEKRQEVLTDLMDFFAIRNDDLKQSPNDLQLTSRRLNELLEEICIYLTEYFQGRQTAVLLRFGEQLRIFPPDFAELQSAEFRQGITFRSTPKTLSSIGIQLATDREGKPLVLVLIQFLGINFGAALIFHPNHLPGNRKERDFFKLYLHQTSELLHTTLLMEELQKKQEQNTRDLTAAQKIQLSLIPKKLPIIAGYEVAARNLAANEVGGDFYDFVFNKSGWYVTMADVMGKSIPAAIYMVHTHSFLNKLINEQSNLSKLLSQLNNELFHSMGDLGIFATMALIKITPSTFQYASAGHEPIIYWDSEKNSVKLLETRGPVLGLSPDLIYPYEEVAVRSGDVLVIYTDGVTEARNNKETFGRKRLIDCIERAHNYDAASILEIVFNEVICFGEHKRNNDDLTLIVLKKL